MRITISSAVLSLFILLVTPGTGPSQKSTRPVFRQVDLDPNLPSLLLIGDSISMGYTIPVRRRLAGRMNVQRPPANCGPTARGLKRLDTWIGDVKWDVIHFNWGLHDLKYIDEAGKLTEPGSGSQLAPVAQYEKNLDALVTRLEATGAKLIWASTTPVPKGAKGRAPGDAVRYNEAAARVMARHNVAINDLHAFTIPRLGDLQRPRNVHFTARGSATLAARVASTVLGALGRVHRVPGDHPTVQAAVDAAPNGGVVLLAPGLYAENVVLTGKTLTLASRYYTSLDSQYVGRTILDGGGETVLRIQDAGPATQVIGLTIQNGDDGISAHSKIEVSSCHFFSNTDAIDYEGGGGICRGNLFRGNRDDAVDLDGPCEVTVEGNLILDNRDDGIEIRLHPYSGPTLEIHIRRNTISGSGEDGIQFIDYGTESDRTFRIERNVIVGSAMAAIGCMGGQNTRENYEAAPIPEPILVANNTISGGVYGLTGGANTVVVNNVFTGLDKAAMLRVAGASVASHNLFWANGTDMEACGSAPDPALCADPLLGAGHRPGPGSPCIDAGVPRLDRGGLPLFEIPADQVLGAGPDLGALEVK